MLQSIDDELRILKDTSTKLHKQFLDEEFDAVHQAHSNIDRAEQLKININEEI